MGKGLYIWGFFLFVLILNIHQEAYGKPPPANGVIRELYSNGRIHLEFRYKKSRIVLKRAWYRSGRLMLDYRYQNGEPYVKKDYYENGRLKSIWYKKTGVMKVYRVDGSFKAAVGSRASGLYY